MSTEDSNAEANLEGHDVVRLRPHDDVLKMLISTPSEFKGEYEKDGLLIAQVKPNFPNSPAQIIEVDNPWYRQFLVVARRIPPREQNSLIIATCDASGDIVCTYLSILYGKRFDNHGSLETRGLFRLPHSDQLSFPSTKAIPQNDNKPRNDLMIPLDLSEVERVWPLVCSEDPPAKFRNYIKTAGSLYVQALRNFEVSPMTAYLNLVSCGEVLSNYFEYSSDELLDEDTKAILNRVERAMNDGQSVANQLKGRLRQVKRRFVKTLSKLLNANFYSTTECTSGCAKLTEDSISERIAAAYDLRSKYLHAGDDVGRWFLLDVKDRAEVQTDRPILTDKELEKVLAKAPTYFGLERIMRYCLLRFIHTQGKQIDPRLDDDVLP